MAGVALGVWGSVTVTFMGPAEGGGVLSPLPFAITHFQEGGGAKKADDKPEQSEWGQGCVISSPKRCVQGVGPPTHASSHRHLGGLP